MPITVAFDELLAYTDEERSKWNAWIRSQPPSVLLTPVQHGGRFPSVWSLLDHLFVVERRHLQRIRGEYPLPDSTGIVQVDWDELWNWAVETRGQLVSLAAGLTEHEARLTRTVHLPAGPVDVTPRKLLFHVLFHEIRHWAQIALALRNAGYEPPGDHDLVFSSVLA